MRRLRNLLPKNMALCPAQLQSHVPQSHTLPKRTCQLQAHYVHKPQKDFHKMSPCTSSPPWGATRLWFGGLLPHCHRPDSAPGHLESEAGARGQETRLPPALATRRWCHPRRRLLAHLSFLRTSGVRASVSAGDRDAGLHPCPGAPHWRTPPGCSAVGGGVYAGIRGASLHSSPL